MVDDMEMTVIGRDASFKGEICDARRVSIFGTIEGTIVSVGDLHVGTGANCGATIEAERVVIDGRVHGDITATDVLTLDENAYVEGDIVAGTLVVKDGASFVGNCRVGTSGGGAKDKIATPKKRIKLVPTEAPVVRQVVEAKPMVVTRVGTSVEEVAGLRLSPMEAAS
jgi:cytoskeletal protein CcmA (bactofilin family)